VAVLKFEQTYKHQFFGNRSPNT